jgi:hypothetical protein
MVTIHLQTYDNLRVVLERHFEIGAIWRPLVEAAQLEKPDYAVGLLEPTFHADAPAVVAAAQESLANLSAKKVEDELRTRILQRTLPHLGVGEALFRALSDRMLTLRLLNTRREVRPGGEFVKSYSPCVPAAPPHPWYTRLDIRLTKGETFTLYFPEPDMADPNTLARVFTSIEDAFGTLAPAAGYFDLPEVRDFVCERLLLPEAAFDEALNCLLDRQPAVLTVGLQYEGISSRRKPLVRTRETTQIYNLIRRA